MEQFSIRPLSSDYVKQIANLEKIIFPFDPWSENAFLSETTSPYSHSLIAVDNNNMVVGYIIANCVYENGAINNLGVALTHRKQGIAKQLISEYISIAKQKKVSDITLEVRQSNTPAISLYESFGFKTISIRKNFYKNPTENANLMLLHI